MKTNPMEDYLEQDSGNAELDEALHSIDTWSQQYGVQFLSSEAVQKLTSYEKEKSLEVLESFARFCYICEQEKPEQWTPTTAAYVCENIFPAYIPEKDEFFKATLSILPAFLQWAEKKEIIENTTPLQESIRSVEKGMLEKANDVEHWNDFKTFLMTAREVGVDISNEEELGAFLEEYKKTLDEVAEGFYDEDDRPYPKQDDEIESIKDIIEDLEYVTHGYPYPAVFEALTCQKEITPALLDMLIHAIENHKILDKDYIGHLHALFLLAQFREKKAFPFILELASLPEEYVENLLGDIVTENLHQVLGSVYDGNLDSLKAFIEARELNIWSRDAGLKTLLVLVKENILERDFVINYLKQLFHHPSFMKDEDALTQLVLAACDLYPIECYDEIKAAFQTEKVDLSWITLGDIDDMLEREKEEVLKEDLYESSHYDLIDDAVTEMMNWPCFAASEYEEDEDDFESESQHPGSDIPYQRETPKVGRNDLCPCGSGKKYKKCCA
jgi:hypothetical protein